MALAHLLTVFKNGNPSSVQLCVCRGTIGFKVLTLAKKLDIPVHANKFSINYKSLKPRNGIGSIEHFADKEGWRIFK